MNYLVGTPVNSLVAKSIEDRQKIFEANDGSLRQAYIQYQSLTPWVRLSSSVKIKAGSKTAEKFGVSGYDLAKNNVLFTLFDKQVDGLPGYEKTQLGYRPAPGIQDMSIHSHNRFGSLRTAVVKFQCWSKEQLDILEILYMRPGFTVFLEWGWSGYLVNDQGSYHVDTLVEPIDFTSYDTRIKATDAMVLKRSKYKYHYDGIAGIIKNFSWSLRADGGYDCSTYIVTAGDAAESLLINFYVSNQYLTEAVQSATEEINSRARTDEEVVNIEGMGEVKVFSGFSNGLEYFTVDELSRGKSREDIAWGQLTPKEAAAEAKVLYDGFVKSVNAALANTNQKQVIRGFDLATNLQPLQPQGLTPLEAPKPASPREQLINPVERTFAFSNTANNSILNGPPEPKILNAAAETLVKSNPNLEIVRKASKPGDFVVLRLKL